MADSRLGTVRPVHAVLERRARARSAAHRTQEDRVRVLYVAYPLLPVSENSAGGAEQMLWTLEREMHAQGHATTVAACAGSRVAGEVIVTGTATREPDTF